MELNSGLAAIGKRSGEFGYNGINSLQNSS